MPIAQLYRGRETSPTQNKRYKKGSDKKIAALNFYILFPRLSHEQSLFSYRAVRGFQSNQIQPSG